MVVDTDRAVIVGGVVGSGTAVAQIVQIEPILDDLIPESAVFLGIKISLCRVISALSRTPRS